LYLVWVFQLLAFCNPPLEVGPLRAPITSFSHRHISQRCFGQITPEPSPVDRSAFFVLCLIWFPYILFHLFYFVLIFLCILFLLGFPVFALVFLYIASFCLFRVFFSFYSSADLLRACFATLRPLLGLFPRPYLIELPTRPSMYKIYLHAIDVKE
jgi:hypothetical protein